MTIIKSSEFTSTAPAQPIGAENDNGLRDRATQTQLNLDSAHLLLKASLKKRSDLMQRLDHEMEKLEHNLQTYQRSLSNLDRLLGKSAHSFRSLEAAL